MAYEYYPTRSTRPSQGVAHRGRLTLDMAAGLELHFGTWTVALVVFIQQRTGGAKMGSGRRYSSSSNMSAHLPVKGSL
jgi:hypothetical protein